MYESQLLYLHSTYPNYCISMLRSLPPTDIFKHYKLRNIGRCWGTKRAEMYIHTWRNSRQVREHLQHKRRNKLLSTSGGWSLIEGTRPIGYAERKMRAYWKDVRKSWTVVKKQTNKQTGQNKTCKTMSQESPGVAGISFAINKYGKHCL